MPSGASSACTVMFLLGLPLRMFSSVDCSSIKASSLRTASAKEDDKSVTSLEVAIEAAAALVEKRGKF
jgi:hypothetical protein